MVFALLVVLLLDPLGRRLLGRPAPTRIAALDALFVLTAASVAITLALSELWDHSLQPIALPATFGTCVLVAGVMIAAALMGKRVEYRRDADPSLDSIARYALSDRPVTPIDPPVRPTHVEPARREPEAERTFSRLDAATLNTPAPRPAPTDGRVTAVLVTRDRPRSLLRAISSVERSDTRARVLVIDNNSAPASADALAVACHGRKDTVLERSERNLGCAGGRRLGVELADTELLLFLDDDAELMPGALDHLVAQLDRHPDAGAVTATVVQFDGTVFHSGGAMVVTDEMVTFELLLGGACLSFDELPPSGPSGWTPGTATLARRELLTRFPLDPGMRRYYEDNEWWYRVSRTRPASFRRSSEAFVLHYSRRKHPTGSDFASRSYTVEMLAGHARLYALHGRLLGPWLFDHVPELCAGGNGDCDLAAARLLMELIEAKGTDWTLMAWMNGDLTGLLNAHRREVRLRAVEAELTHERAEARARAGELADLDARLRRTESSLTWQLFQRARARTFRLLGGEQSRGVRLVQATLRLVGRALPRARPGAGGSHPVD